MPHCEFCKKEFSTIYNLQRHKNVNKKCALRQEKPIVNITCEYCKKEINMNIFTKHENSCNEKSNFITLLKNENEQLKIKNLNYEKQIQELYTKLKNFEEKEEDKNHLLITELNFYKKQFENSQQNLLQVTRTCFDNSFCIHNKRKRICKDCDGSAFCEHDKLKTRCKICDGRDLCKSSWCETSGNKKYDGYCLACFVNNPENSDKPTTRNYKKREKDVVERIIKFFPDFSWVHDKQVQDGCSRRRPDLLCHFGSHVIIVEIDENKHSEYDCSCENKRLMQLSQDLNHIPIVFIRFNPDS
jgi:hypothetical protein